MSTICVFASTFSRTVYLFYDFMIKINSQPEQSKLSSSLLCHSFQPKFGHFQESEIKIDVTNKNKIRFLFLLWFSIVQQKFITNTVMSVKFISKLGYVQQSFVAIEKQKLDNDKELKRKKKLYMIMGNVFLSFCGHIQLCGIKRVSVEAFATTAIFYE